MRIDALLLAAGAARRFGSDKRLHPLHGQPMLARTLAVYRQVFDRVGVVIRPGEPEVARLVRAGRCRPVEAQDAALGQSRSLAAGVAALADADGLVIGLGDMPYVQGATLAAIEQAMRQHPAAIVRPRHAARAGNPVGFPRAEFDSLQRLRGDAGARQAIAGSGRVHYLDVDDDGVLRDIDRAEDAL